MGEIIQVVTFRILSYQITKYNNNVTVLFSWHFYNFLYFSESWLTKQVDSRPEGAV